MAKIDLAQFKDLFVSEAEDHLQKLNEYLLKLEKKKDDQGLLDALMRAAHSLKGAAATMEYRQFAFLAHVLEDVFDYTRNNVLRLTPPMLNVLFQAVDTLEKSLEAIKKSGKESDISGIAKRLKKITGVATQGMGKSLRTAEGQPLKKPVELEETIPAAGLPPEQRIEPISHIKVPARRLDDLMALVEELMIDKMKLEAAIGAALRRFVSAKGGAGAALTLIQLSPFAFASHLKPLVDHLSHLVSSLQYQVTQVRLVGVEQIFARFPRMVRDLANNQQKEVEFEMTGSGLKLDRSIVDKLGEPLVHLLRNAVDHGIEKRGRIKLEAQREKDHARITVENLGKSVDWPGIIDAALKRQMINAETAQKLRTELSAELKTSARPPKEVERLLYLGRVSTKTVVTETSGRGVGLSVVKNFVDQIGGRLAIDSPLERGPGARFTLELPLTLAIISSLMVDVGGRTFAIPFSSIERIVMVSRKDIKSMADQDVAIVEGGDVPLVWLGRVFGLDSAASTSELLTIVIVGHGRDKAGIVIDEPLDAQDIIVKTLPSPLRVIKGFSGSTILGDGRTILILDVASLLEDTKQFLRV